MIWKSSENKTCRKFAIFSFFQKDEILPTRVNDWNYYIIFASKASYINEVIILEFASKASYMNEVIKLERNYYNRFASEASYINEVIKLEFASEASYVMKLSN